MTGYGRAEAQTEQRKITVEIKSLNSKQLDLSTRIPGIYREKEYEIRGLVAKALGRGKVDLFVSVENMAGKSAPGAVNRDLFFQYYSQLQEIASEIGYDTVGEPLLQTILKMPDVMQTESIAIDEQEWTVFMDTVKGALESIDHFRQQEGAVLIADLLGRIDRIEELAKEVIPYENERVERVRTRLQENLQNYNVTVDQNRFEQEVIYYLEKFDITEEKVRLAQHCEYFRTVSRSEGAGRKLGFLAQEIGREINTMGSKANHAEIQKLVVLMKDELEKIKEQLLNIL